MFKKITDNKLHLSQKIILVNSVMPANCHSKFFFISGLLPSRPSLMLSTPPQFMQSNRLDSVWQEQQMVNIHF